MAERLDLQLDSVARRVSSNPTLSRSGRCLSIAFNLLLICILFASGSAIHDGYAVQSSIAVLAALALASVGISARAADVSSAAQVTRGFRLAAALPVIWMVIQILPTPIGAHSIWAYANKALGQQSWGHVSADLGATILALALYLANVSLITVSLFAAMDRRRAELMLFVLTAATAIASVALLLGKWGLITGLAESQSNEMLGAISALGILLSLACGVRAIERYESKAFEPVKPVRPMQLALMASGAALLLCLGGLASGATLNVGLCTAFGIVTFALVQVIRRSGLAGWTVGILVATMTTAAAMIIIWRYDSVQAISPVLQFATASSADAISIARRLLSDTGWLGAGAGTYAVLLPIYQDFGSSVTGAPSTASALAIELGWPMAIFGIAVAIGLIAILYRGALVRGRDSFYPAAAAACTVVMLAQAFCDSSLLNSSVSVVGDTLIGLGLAQSVSRRDRP